MKSIRCLSVLIVFSLLISIVPVAYASGPSGSWVSGIACQNLDSNNDASGTLSFFKQGESTATLDYPLSITKGTSKNYYTPNLSGLGTSFLGSVVVNSSTQLACSVNTEAGAGTTTAPYRKGTSSGFSADQISTVAYVPQLHKNFVSGTNNWNSYLAIQNTGGSTVSVEVSYRDRYGTAISSATQTFDIVAYSNKILYQNENANLPDQYMGSAYIRNVSSAPANTINLAVVANIYNKGTDNTNAQFRSYNAFPSGGSTLFFPRFIRRYYGFNSGMSIQNTADNSVYVKIEFYFAGNTYIYQSGEIAPKAALALYSPNISAINAVDTLPMAKRSGSCKIITTDAAGNPVSGEIVAIANEDNLGSSSDNNGSPVPAEQVGQGISYNGFQLGTETNKVFIPQFVRFTSSRFNGGFVIANTTNTATTCNISYNSDMDANETNVPLAGNGVIIRYAPNVANLNNGYNASVTVTCGQPIFGMYNFSAAPGTGGLGDSFITNNAINQ